MNAQKRFTMISLIPSRPKAYIGASGSRFKAVHHAGAHYIDPEKVES